MGRSHANQYILIPDIKEQLIYGYVSHKSGRMRIVQCKRCLTVRQTTARTNRPQCTRAIERAIGFHKNVRVCSGAMIECDIVKCWSCHDWIDVNKLDGLLICPLCAAPLRRPHVVKPFTVDS